VVAEGDDGGTEHGPVEVPADLRGSAEVVQAVDGLLSALRSEAARLKDAQMHAADRQASDIVEDARRDAARMREDARALLDRATRRYEAVVRVVGQLIGTLAEIRDQAAAELQALRRESDDLSEPPAPHRE
jgi:hypothetical protein